MRSCLLGLGLVVMALAGMSCRDSSAVRGAAGEGAAARESAAGSPETGARPPLPAVNIATGEVSAEEAEALDAALRACAAAPGDPGPLEAFLAANPDGSHALAVRIALSRLYYKRGRLSDVMRNARLAWEAARHATDRTSRALADRAYGDYAEMLAFFGKRESLRELVDSVADREVSPNAAYGFLRARESLVSMERNTAQSHLCGPHSLFCILRAQGADNPDVVFESGVTSTAQGMNFAQVQALADEAGMDLAVARHAAGRSVPVPAVISWKEGHFSAVTRRTADGRLVVEDTMFRQPLRVAPETLLAESSGYFMVPRTALGGEWREVPAAEAATVWGAHTPVRPEEDDKDPCKDAGCGMAVWSVDRLHVDLRLRDTPLLYQPAFGPGVAPTFTYNYLSTNQPAVFDYVHAGPNWNLDYVTFVEGDFSDPDAGIFRFQPNGGGGRHFSPAGSGSYETDSRTLSRLTRESAGSYRIDHRDGSFEIFDVPDLNGGRLFCSSYTDPQGNTVSYQYDAQVRLTAVVDATGNSMTLAYGDPDPLRVTSISDPYGRQAVLTYHPTGQLASITDAIGITSSFTYGDGGFITALDTPYGTTQFDRVDDGQRRTLTITMPNGDRQRFRHYLFGSPAEISQAAPAYPVPAASPLINPAPFGPCTTFYWDRKAMHYHEDDATKAVMHAYQFSEGTRFNTVNVLAAIKPPLENPVFFVYPGQTNPFRAGTLDQAGLTARVLPDGSEQVTVTEYNSLGLPTRQVDPLGRETLTEYAPNDIDVTTVRQKVAGGATETLGEVLGYLNHRPLQVRDAAGELTTFTYNARGQLLTTTDALNRVVSIDYLEGDPDTPGFGMPDQVTSYRVDHVTSFTYDAFERVESITGPDGYSTTHTYDNFDRPLTVAYPDGTQSAFDYLHLDLVRATDREGRRVEHSYDAIRQRTTSRDAEGRQTRFKWCRCGGLEELTDALGRVTRWNLDLQGRLVSKVLPDGRTFSYAYDDVGRRLSRTDPLGQVCSYTYNLDDTVATKDFLNTVNPTAGYTYAYDPHYLRVTSVTDGFGATSYTYHPYNGATHGAGQVATIDGPWANDTCTKTYDALGRLLGDNLQNSPLGFAYDVLGRVDTLTDALGATTYTFDGPTARILTATRPDGLSSACTYKPLAEDFRLASITHSHSSAGVLSSFSHEYSPLGRIMAWTRQRRPGEATQRFDLSYDRVDQLTRAALTDTATGNVLDNFQFRYDQVGNRLSVHRGSALISQDHDVANQLTDAAPGGTTRIEGRINRLATSITVDGQPAAQLADGRFFIDADLNPGLNQLPLVIEEPGGPTTNKTLEIQVDSGEALVYTYDLNGNLTAVAPAATPAQPERTFTWDAGDRLLSVTRHLPGQTLRTEFGYNERSERVERREFTDAVLTEHVRYIWHGNVLRQKRDATGGTVLTTFAPGGELDVAGGNIKRHYLRDHLGSVRNLIDSAGTEIASYDYTPFGERSLIAGTHEAEIGYTGHSYHPPTGLVLALHRAYDPGSGRWLSLDPLGESGGLNLYSFVLNDPVNLVDPDGLNPIGALIGFVEGVARTYVEPLAERAGSYVTLANAGQTSLYGVVPQSAFDHKAALKNGCQDAAIGLAGGKIIQGTGRLLKQCRRAPTTTPKPVKPGSFDDNPPGWNENWDWHSSTRARKGQDGWRWRDEQGGEWRRHSPDKHHPEAHWDYNPNDAWNSPWKNVDDNGNLLLFTSP
ncbi:MAG: hypothetical protein HKN82_17785 [Akkermansiaceae bacterium]|nr:hypothetical protein [Akkermansiaceae bacterium]